MSSIAKKVEKRWKQEGVKYQRVGRSLEWHKTLRTVDCIFCKNHQVEPKIDAGFLNWSLLLHEFDAIGKVPEVCPVCIKKISRDLIPPPRFAECPICHTRQREKIFGVGWPGWRVMVSTGRPQQTEIVRNLACPNCVLDLARKLGKTYIRETWTSLTYTPGSLLTSGKMTANQANFLALVAPDTGAPKVVPQGGIIMWSGTLATVPSGWSLCDGTGGTPDLRAKFVRGAPAATNPGGTGGADSITLAIANLPSHTHGKGSLSVPSVGNHTHKWGYLGKSGGGGGTHWGFRHGEIENDNATTSAGAHTHTISGSTASTGSGSAFNNRPAYYEVAYIMKL